MSRVASICVLLCLLAAPAQAQDTTTLVLPAEVVADKIHGGMLGQILGNLNGLEHEMKYIQTPGKVSGYQPALPEGAWTDDDTDLEWVYISAMARDRTVLLPAKTMAELWTKHINRNIWCANLYARQLIDLGLEPPLTGRIALNPWAEFNISGQFVCESFALASPGMPQTASKIALHYTQATIDGEPAQATQLFAGMLASAFVPGQILDDDPRNRLTFVLDNGLASVDPKSQIAGIVRNVRLWYAESPDDWRAVREKIAKQYTRHGGDAMRDKNGYELNTASTIAALLYGRVNFARTLETAFNFGWDCDNNAATSGAIVGAILGKKQLTAAGWKIADRYKNTSRDEMPTDETISGFADKVVALSRRVVQENGGSVTTVDGLEIYNITRQVSKPVELLPSPLNRLPQLKEKWLPTIKQDLQGSQQAQARAAYLAICLGESGRLQNEQPKVWQAAIASLQKYPQVVAQIFAAPAEQAAKLQTAAKAAGLKPPASQK